MKNPKALLFVLWLCLAPASALAQEHAPAPPVPAAAADGHHAQPAGEHAAGAEADHAAAGAEHEGGGILETVAKLLNFAVLVWILVHFLRRPIANYLVDRSQQIRRALVEAEATRAAASENLTRIDARIAALPAELEALKLRGAEEVKTEQVRIAAAAAAERERMLAQTRRDIDQQYRLARRALVQETATQAAAVARARIERDLTPADQSRLIDRYLQQVHA
jgi:F-type H+-transporting ATPase subunit b